MALRSGESELEIFWSRADECGIKADCEDSLLPLGCLDDQSGEKSISLRGRDRLRDDPQWFPCSLKCYSWIFQERLRNKSELVGSEGTR